MRILEDGEICEVEGCGSRAIALMDTDILARRKSNKITALCEHHIEEEADRDGAMGACPNCRCQHTRC